MIVYIEYLICEAKSHLVLTPMISKLSLNIEISPQMCYNTLKNEQNLSLFDRGRGLFQLGVKVNDTNFTLSAAFQLR